MVRTDPTKMNDPSRTNPAAPAAPAAPTAPTPRRQTQQRTAIVAALSEHGEALSAQELHALVEGVGLATVYRNLGRLADDGEIDVIRRPGGELAYRACSTGHHHHLVCRDCGRVVEIHDCTIGDWAAKLARRHGFTAVEHQAELVGTCATCRGVAR